jgi:ADP-ribose pyrophosphatase YjhB (NUDIX family)
MTDVAHEELLQCFDESGNPTEARLRSEVKQQPPRFWYGVARVWVVNNQGEILVSRRSDKMDVAGGKWSTWFGGHVGAGETIKETAQRELREEAGLDIALEEFFFVDKGQNEAKKVFFENYAVRFNGALIDLKAQDDEVTEVKWMSISNCQSDASTHPERWANHIHDEQKVILSQWLQ